jgi:hypothetical protein
MTGAPALTETEKALLRAGFRHRIVEPNVEAGFERFARLTDGVLDEPAFHAAIARCLARGLIRDPIRLPEGALQCHWHFELTPAGIKAARELVGDGGS